MLARADAQPAGAEAALLPLAMLSPTSEDPSRWRLGVEAPWQAIAVWQPDLHALQILRC